MAVAALGRMATHVIGTIFLQLFVESVFSGLPVMVKGVSGVSWKVDDGFVLVPGLRNVNHVRGLRENLYLIK